MQPKQNFLQSKRWEDISRISSYQFLHMPSKNKSLERKEKAESYLKDLGSYLYSLRSNHSNYFKPFSFSKSPEVRKKLGRDNCRKKRRNTTRTDLSNIDWKQLSSNLIELEKELDSKYSKPDYSQTLHEMNQGKLFYTI